MNTDYARKNQQIANSFYNLGLEKARIRDLSGAAQCLKKSLHFNKYQTDARNLLGRRIIWRTIIWMRFRGSRDSWR